MSDGMTEEQYCLDRIAELEREFRKAAEPWIKRLATLESLKPMSFTVRIEQLSPEFQKSIKGKVANFQDNF